MHAIPRNGPDTVDQVRTVENDVVRPRGHHRWFIRRRAHPWRRRTPCPASQLDCAEAHGAGTPLHQDDAALHVAGHTQRWAVMPGMPRHALWLKDAWSGSGTA